ncbi:MAG: putative ABC transport system permease protein [Verrucomicrobiales bacterium]|jgi:putative ABC transport system permease protein
MSLLSLIVQEIAHRKGSFILGVVSVGLAIVCLCGTVLALRGHDVETEALSASIEETTRQEMARLEDEIRKSMKGLGFNIFIYPEGQDMSEVYSQGYASKTMPESYVHTLAQTKIVTVNHLLPQLTRKIKWPEYERTILLIGVRGEVPIAHRDPKKPLIDPVQTGSLVLGYELQKSLQLNPGDEVKVLGETFVIAKCHAERGSVDDISIWMNLTEAQRLLDAEGQINSILALECNCASLDRLGEIRNEIASILPGTQVIETESKALARAEARNLAKRTAANQLASMQADRAEQRAGREKLAAWLSPLVALGSMTWIAFLTFTNVRQRLAEIGTLRAIGVTSGRILTAFLGRAACTGIAGVLLAVILLSGIRAIGAFNAQGLAVSEWALLAIGAPLLASIAAWLPALNAVALDPARLLRHD